MLLYLSINQLITNWSQCYIYCVVVFISKVMYTDSPMVASAPTGSGKTVLFELAIIRLLMQIGEGVASTKIVYGNARAQTNMQSKRKGIVPRVSLVPRPPHTGDEATRT